MSSDDNSLEEELAVEEQIHHEQRAALFGEGEQHAALDEPTMCPIRRGLVDDGVLSDDGHTAAVNDANDSAPYGSVTSNSTPRHDALDGHGRTCIAPSTKLPTLYENERPMLVETVLTKVSPMCANPGKLHLRRDDGSVPDQQLLSVANMDHFRSGMLLEVDPLERTYMMTETKKKFYEWATPETDRRAATDHWKFAPYDGSAMHMMQRIMEVVNKTEDKDSKLNEAAGVIQENLARGEIGCVISVHVPMQRLLPETDDRGLATEESSCYTSDFAVNEQRILKRGRYSWTLSDPEYRFSNTQISLGYIRGVSNSLGLTFRYLGRKPVIEIDNREGSSVTLSAPKQELAALLGFSQYSEYELAKARPSSYVPIRVLQLLAAVAPHKNNLEHRIAAILMQLGEKIRYDSCGTCFIWTGGTLWVEDEGGKSVRTAIQAAASDVEYNLNLLAGRSDIDVLWNRASQYFHYEAETVADKNGTPTPPMLIVRGCKIMPQSERAEANFNAKLRPYLVDDSFAKSFEKCKDLGFPNGVQQMTPPFAFHPATPADRVTNYFGVELPAPPTSQEEREELEAIALEPFLEVFVDRDVALRELDKAACLLTGTCTVMIEANFRIQVGPYNDALGQYAGGVGKDTLGNHIGAVLGDYLCDDWGTSMLSTTIEPDRNNPGFEGLEKHLGHWITDGSATKRDDSGALRKWGDLAKKIWAGGAPTRFAVTLKHKNKKLVLPRSNAAYVSAQKFNIGNDTGIWRRIECSPYPRVANIPENKSLVDAGVPSFEIDSNYTNVATNMNAETRGKHLRY
jgi:hypothetical protein